MDAHPATREPSSRQPRSHWKYAAACAAAIAAGAFEATQRPTTPKQAGVWIAIILGIAGMLWRYRAVALPLIGSLAWAVVAFATDTTPPNSGDSHSVVVYLLLGVVFGVVFLVPTTAGALLRLLWDRGLTRTRR
jgi:hypothetical protein